MSEGAASASAYRGGETISHYRVLGLLGAGGMGVVYKALDLQLERTVALKFLPHQSTNNELKQLLNEARAASQLDHTNIGVVHGLEQTEDGQWFIVMAYYDGITLERKLGTLLTIQALEIAAQIARGLAEAHRHNVVHRDIKPSNILLTNSGTAKIVDFGIARLVTTPSETLSAGSKGTMAYMSPEQINGQGVDHRSDIWALGVVLAQMLTGRYPFRGDNVGAKVYAILNEPPLALDEVPVGVQAIVYKALAKKPADRYQSCEEMLSDIEQARAVVSAASRGAAPSEATINLQQFVQRASVLAQTKPQAPPIKRWRVSIAVLLIGILLGVVAVPKIIDWVAGGGQKEKHIAVLPFDVIGADPEIAPLADGLMDSLTSKLSNLDPGQQSFWVVPASVVRKQKVDDPGTALRTLGATLVVKGSIQRAGPRVRLIVNLINTRDVRQLASADFQDESGDFAVVQDQAVEKLSHVMHVGTGTLNAEVGNASVAGAYESYLKALGYMQRYDKPGNLDLAIKELTSATQLDTRFALGFAQLAEAYRLKFKVEKDPQWTDKALTTCKKALAISDKIPSAWVTWGRIHSDTGKYELALQEFQKALNFNPRDHDAHSGLARAYEDAGRIGEAEDALKKAITLAPEFWDGYNALGLFYDRQRRYPEAIAQLKKAIELTPDNGAAWANLAAIYLDTEEAKYAEDATKALQRSLELAPTYAAYANLGFLYLQQKKYADAANATEKALAINANNAQVWENMAVAREWLGDKEKATAARQRQLELLERELKNKPNDAQTQAKLAYLYGMMRQPGKAKELINSSLAIAPTDTAVLTNVGEAYEVIGDRKSALRYLSAALHKGLTMAELQRSYRMQSLITDPALRGPGH